MENPQPIPSAEIVCEGVSRQFPNVTIPAVDHVNLQVETGSFVVLVGPSGSGKTTLLKMINRLYEPSSGKIWVGGTEVHDLPVTELRRRIGYVIQQIGLFPHMTNEENISVVPRLLGWDRARINERITALLDMVGLPQSYRKRYPRQLSGGEQQRIGLARALAADPEILLMDEPFAAIDAINRECLQDEFLEIQRKVHKTIVFVTHDVEEAFKLADKIAIIREGKLVQFGTPLEIVSRPQNEFVEELVGTGNMLRRLSLLEAGSVLQARGSWASERALMDINNTEKATVTPESDLRSVLACMLESGGDAVEVVDRDGRQIGEITFADLRTALVKNLPKAQEPG
jgi:osmoprotectant transport system ATP-binding protein